MNKNSDTPESTLITLAVKQGYLSEDAAERLFNEAREQAISTLDLAYQQGVLNPQDVEQLTPLQNPLGTVPDYQILDLLGVGGMGAVYSARQLKLDRVIALKLMKQGDANSASRSHQEAKLVARLRHPNIITAYDYGVSQGRIFLAMEMIDGQSLLEFVNEKGSLDERLALKLLRQVAAALSYATEQGITHRDIKPGNLLLTRDDTGLQQDSNIPIVKVADFGLARFMGDINETRLTLDGSTLGTPAYAAPEQMQDSNVDERADIYSLGATLYFMLHGESPCSGQSVMKVISNKLNGDIGWSRKLPDSCSEACQDLVNVMTTPEPENRLSDYVDIIRRIDDILQDTLSTEDRNKRSAQKGKSWRPSNKHMTLLKWSVFALALTCGILIAFQWTPETKSPEFVRADLKASNMQAPPLFNGVSVPLRGAKSGTWRTTTETLEKGLTGATVLSGMNGTHEFKFPGKGFELYQLQLSVNPLENARVDLLLGSEKQIQRTTIRLQDQQIQLGITTSASQEFSPLENFSALPFSETGEQPRYQRLTMVHQADGWIISVNGEELGAVYNQLDEHPHQFDLQVTEGMAHFSDFRVVQLIPALNANTGQ
ncbi:serine/threonine-protein kinase [Rubinisphaera italica]|uniref:Serine/threonine-protein kinase PK-1 n=1 Tax=Rubinisphaera italica TaxID=2527969 RepID=A0A5C5XKZ4_9PLAN|nr:serine/threonine-protein kinase [Rubinisphaera italica]TWT62815.1 Serine/threonine-protein kinase PK-1 [Rubinisphaera italica]